MREEMPTCQNCKSQFKLELEDYRFYQNIKVPPPTFCPKCRAARRHNFWNQRRLFRKTDARSGEQIFSTFPQASPVKIYDHDYWWSDKWDPTAYGKEYDFSKTFFEQFGELALVVPWPSLSIKNLVRSDYCNQAADLKNCYLCFDGNTSEDCLYGVGFSKMRNCLDFYQCTDDELCYELFSSDRCFQAFFCTEVFNCRNVWFCINCSDCSECFGCMNLRHKKYHIFNVPHSKAEYYQKIKEFNLGSYAMLRDARMEVRKFWNRFPMKYMHGINNLNAVGEYVYHSKNVKYCYQVLEIENAGYSQNIVEANDFYDYTSWGMNTELVYESAQCGSDCLNIKFCFDCWPGCENIEYCMSCHASTDLFGCVGLKKKQYCILNKQYDKKSFEMIRAKIIDQMNDVPYTDKKGRVYRYGEFFPMELSPLAYNESSAEDYFPMEKQKAVEAGYLWRDPELKEYPITVKANDLPDRIEETKNGMTKEIIACSSCGQAYRILQSELVFYKRFGLPLPRICHNCRYAERIKFRNPLKWYERKCMCGGKESEKSNMGNIYKNVSLPHKPHKNGDQCPNIFETSFASERPEIVYCEQCYNAEVV